MRDSQIRIFCPRCRREASMSIPVEAMEVEQMAAMPAPEGFRKVQVGAFSDSVELFCIDCGVPALLKDFVASQGLLRH